MSAIKKALKAAKAALDSKDSETAHDEIQFVLKKEPNNYFGHIFLAKYEEQVGHIEDTSKAFEKAINIEPKNPLAWKGFYQFLLKGKDFVLYFDVLTKYLELQFELEVNIYDTLNDFQKYLNRNNYKQNKVLYEIYLNNIIPGLGSSLGDMIGQDRMFGGMNKNVRDAIEFFSKKEDEEVKTIVAKERMKFSANLSAAQQQIIRDKTWDARKHLKLPKLYELFLSITDDDDLRAKYEDKYLSYKLELLKVHQTKEAGLEFKEFVDDMVFIKTKNLHCWRLYWDLCDVNGFAATDLNISNLVYFIGEYELDPLARVLLAYLMSDICTIEDKDSILQKIQITTTNSENITTPQSLDDVEGLTTEQIELLKSTVQNNSNKISDNQNDTSMRTLSAEEILELMLQGYSEAKDSILAGRLFATYLLHLVEYQDAYTVCKETVKQLANWKRTSGMDLLNSKIDILCSQAVVYTYFEAPKNYPRALQLYAKVHQDEPNNVRASIGKSVILIEMGDYEKAAPLLSRVLEFQPDSVDAVSEFGWCQIMLKDFEAGRRNLEKALKLVQGSSVRSFELRSAIECRIARSYLKEDGSNADFIKKAYDYLIQALKDSKNNARAYTFLGFIYKDAYNDAARASKCFFKAFELDAIEISSAKCLVEDFTAKNQWDVAEIICQRIIESERSRRFLLSVNNEDEDKSWPYRVLGCSALNKQDDAKAIEWFQAALRMTSMDLECWIGLGEAYSSCGRLDAASKVFTFASEKSPDSWIIKYMLGKVQCDMGEYDIGQAILFEALELAPKENVVLAAIYESLLASSKYLVQGNFFGRATEAIIQAIDYIYQSVLIDLKSQMLWKALGDCLRVFLVIQGRLDEVPQEKLQQIFHVCDGILNHLDSEQEFIDEVTYVDNITVFNMEEENYDMKDNVLRALILSGKMGVASLPIRRNNSVRAAAIFNLGLGYYDAYQLNDEVTKYRDLALKCFKRAIQLEPKNATFWVALGNTYVPFNALVAQHCFIKASALETKDASVWCNLATLYLKYGDIELAKETFLRAQSVAPLQSFPWLGQAIASENSGEPGDAEAAQRLFIHGYVVSNGRSHLAQLLYALCIINKRLVSNSSDLRDVETAQELSIANFAMTSYFKFRPNDVIALKIALSISERCKDYRNAITVGERLYKLLEKEYDTTGNTKTALEIAETRAQLARVYLGHEDYENAIECAQFSMEIVGALEADDDNNSAKAKAILDTILSARIVIGLSLFFDGQYDEALEQLQEILTTHGDNHTLICLTAQILNALGTEDTKQASLDQLFSYIESHGSSLLVVLILGCIALVDNISEYFEAVKDELRCLLLEELQNDKRKLIPSLLSQINERMGTFNAKDIWQRNAILFPSDYSVWTQLNNRMALAIAGLKDSKLPAPKYAELYAKMEDLRSIQRSMVLFPANGSVAEALKGI
ncbi:Superkiller protein 3 [Scheffersomyces spartinae]|uniref:Superkiller protein 3 n=1 Tax=Scheffersomyces spartinae TaxID=45513 RepID=A0A9P7V8Q6_9ASCO|nr:Superkiller protein 3 [Scheffersomyces spartinae]KAG7193284.1 Superkiller protein 3 [Scheffersomyces spartinae]